MIDRNPPEYGVPHHSVPVWAGNDQNENYVPDVHFVSLIPACLVTYPIRLICGEPVEFDRFREVSLVTSDLRLSDQVSQH